MVLSCNTGSFRFLIFFGIKQELSILSKPSGLMGSLIIVQLS